MIKNLSIKIFLFVAIAAALMTAKSAEAQFISAQTEPANPSTESFSVSFSPFRPGPNTKVSAQIANATFDIDRAQIVWLIDGNTAGVGKTFSFNTGDLGTRLALKVAVITEDEKALSKAFIFQSADIDLLWETPGYAPAFYHGKILAGPKSQIKVTAIPWGFGADPKANQNLIYEWRRNGKNFADASGPDRQTFDFYAIEAGEELIEVKISNSEKSVIAQKFIRIGIGQPKVLFYEEKPLEGTQYQKELGVIMILEKPEFTIRAEPYFFSLKFLSKLSYEWLMNNKKIEGEQKPNLLRLAVPEDAKGTSVIDFSLFNPINVLERAQKILQININLENE